MLTKNNVVPRGVPFAQSQEQILLRTWVSGSLLAAYVHPGAQSLPFCRAPIPLGAKVGTILGHLSCHPNMYIPQLASVQGSSRQHGSAGLDPSLCSPSGLELEDYILDKPSYTPSATFHFSQSSGKTRSSLCTLSFPVSQQQVTITV